MENRKKIGVVKPVIYSDGEHQLIRGIQREAYDRGYDVLVFSTFTKGNMWQGFLNGEVNIFSLMNFEKLDGIILMLEGFQNFQNFDEMAMLFRERCRCPVLTVDYEEEGIPFLREDTESQLRCVLEHLYEKCEVRDFAFLTGHKDHPHAEKRLKCFLDFMEEKHLALKENRIFYGDFWYDAGDSVVETLIHCDEGLPQAICCASDIMGLSVYGACTKRGIRVPEDILITGYDAEGGNIVLPYFLTSVCIDAETSGRNAVRRVVSEIEGKTYPPFEPKGRLHIGYTCGWKSSFWEEKKAEIDIERMKEDLINDFFTENNFMMEDGVGAPDLTECLWKIDWYTHFLGEFDGCYICLTDDWLGYDREDREFRESGYSDRINLVYRRYHEEKTVDLDCFFDREEMLPDVWKPREKPACFFFTPLHFMNRCFGYSALQYEGEPKVYNKIYWNWTRKVCNMLEAMRRRIMLEKINETLNETYRIMERNAVTDSLTGLYNRNGFNLYVKEQIELAKRRGKKLLVVLADLNGLKEINDTYGHQEGDFAIREAGNAMARFLGDDSDEEGKAYRLGGDEYAVVVLTEGDPADEEERLSRVTAYLDEVNRRSGKPFVVCASIGISVEDPESRSADNLTLAADERMYAEKEAYRARTGKRR